MLRDAGADSGERLSFFAADLEHDVGWVQAVDGCDYVMHVASPVPHAAPKTEDEVIVPARDGVLRVLKAARDANVKRVVLTSTCAAIYYGHPPQKAPFPRSAPRVCACLLERGGLEPPVSREAHASPKSA